MPQARSVLILSMLKEKSFGGAILQVILLWLIKAYVILITRGYICHNWTGIHTF